MPYDTVPMEHPGAPVAPVAPVAPLSPRKRRKLWPILLITALVVSLLATAGYVASGPYRALKGIQTAIAFGDSNGLAKYVDFPTLRQNLKQQLSSRTSDRINATVPNGLLSRLASGIANSVVDASVEALVTPSGLNKLVLGASLISGEFQGETSGTLAQRFENGRSSFVSTDEFTFTISATANREIKLVLTRDGLNWQMTNLVIPIER